MRQARVLVLFWLALLLTAPTAASAQKAPDLMMQKLNEVRQRHGLPQLRYSASLRSSSQRFSRSLMKRDAFAHGARVHASRHFKGLGEVLELHSGRAYRVRHAVRRWLRSPYHRAVLLNPAMRLVGAGATRGRFRGRRATIWVVQVAKGG